MMNTRFPEPLLNQPVSALELSEALQNAAIQNGFHTLADLLELHMTEILKLRGFDHRLWNEYAAFLEAQGFGHYLN